MLEKFILLRNIGRFVNLSSKGDVSLCKLTLIYGENGRCKTTLCSILRSLHNNDSTPIDERKSLGSSDRIKCDIKIDGNHYKFSNGFWDEQYSNLSVFDSTFVHINTMTISGTTPTKKTELELTSVASLTPAIALLEEDKFAVVFEDDSHTNDIGKLIIVTRSGDTLTKASTHWVTFASTQGIKICELDGVISRQPGAPDSNSIAILFDDAGDSNKGKIRVGRWDKFLIDVRSNVASSRFNLWAVSAPGRRRKA